MAKKKRKGFSNLSLEGQVKMEELRYAIVKELGYLVVNSDNYWDELTQKQKSEVQGIITKMMVEKAKQDMKAGLFTF